MVGRAFLGHIGESDFQKILQALSATAKGRSFLAEYGRRCRPEETFALLGALDRIDRSMASVRDQLQPERIADELRRIAMTLEIATESVDAPPDGDALARRMALVAHARTELAAFAAALAGAGETRGTATIVSHDDDHAFLEQLYESARGSAADR